MSPARPRNSRKKHLTMDYTASTETPLIPSESPLVRALKTNAKNMQNVRLSKHRISIKCPMSHTLKEDPSKEMRESMCTSQNRSPTPRHLPITEMINANYQSNLNCLE